VVEHIVCFKFKPEITAGQAVEFVEMLRGLKGKIETIVDLTAGKTFPHEGGPGFTVGLIWRFPGKEGRALYVPRPHSVPTKNRVAEICESTLAVDYEF